jgi:NAD(P)-dependent dehydrogenase (short-subunit alcohol dehydrogenase family)
MSDANRFTSKLAGKRILIIGGTSGLGFAVAQGSLEFGATIIISSSNATKIDNSISRLQTDYPSARSRISGYACDLGSRDVETNIKALFEKVAQDGKIDHIVFTAGENLQFVPLDDVSLEKVEKAPMVRTYAALLVAKIGRSYLNPGPFSSITLTTGTIGEKPIEGGWTMASIVGSAMHALTRQLALELRPVRVNAVSPGAVDTELWDRGTAEVLRKQVEETMPTGRFAEPQDVAEAYLYLMRDANVTGSILSTNSGSLLV